MINKEAKDKAIEILKKILHLFHEKRFGDILSVVSASKIENFEEFLSECVQGTLKLNNFESIDEYGIPCSFKPKYEYSQLDFYNNTENSFVLEYAMTSDSEIVDMVLQLEFSYTEDGEIEGTFVNVEPQ